MLDEKVKITQKETFDVIRSAVNKTVDLIKPTFGPSGNKVIISKLTHGYVLDDGVQIARDLELSDPSENAVLKVVREVAIKTNDRVGDGTTGSLIILQAIIDEIAKLHFRDGRKLDRELKKGFEEAKEQILKSAKTIKTKEDLYKVALVSFDDEKIARLIANAWFKLGVDGVLTVDRSNTMETVMELTDGISLNKGYLSPYMITNPQRMEAVFEKAYILITDFRLTEANDVINIMNKLAEKKILNLVIIADNIEQQALATLLVNKMKGIFNTIAISAPDSGSSRTVFLEDIALMTGAKLFSEKKGDKLEDAKISDLGRCGRFISKRNESIIVDPKGDAKKTKAMVKSLLEALSSESNKSYKEDIKKRIARFSNKVGVIKVGAPTENETNALRYKIEDAVNSTLSAFKGGVVAGAGVGLLELKTSSEILNEALSVPFRQLKNNIGLDSHRPLAKGESINVVTGEIGPWHKIGVMDPAEVLIAQIESAVSIASLLVTSSGMVVEKPQHIKEEQ